MSGLEALGLACSIFQVISFSREVLGIAKRVYQDGSFDESLADYSDCLSNISTHIQTVEIPGTKAKKHELDLIKIAERCQIASRDLREEIAFILGASAKGNLMSTLKVAAKTTWRKRRLDRLEKDLSNAERLMHSGILARICDKNDSIELQQKTSNEELRYFIQQYRAGYRAANDLVTRESQSIRDHTSNEAEKIKSLITNESERSDAAMREHLDAAFTTSATHLSTQLAGLELDKDQQAKRERLLRSLKFPGMNQRRNDVKDAHPTTFQWLFSEETDAETASDLSDSDFLSLTKNYNSFNSLSNSDIRWDSISSNQIEAQWDRFPDWLRSNAKVYWISGKPGSGKTTLANFILSEPRTAKLLDLWQPNSVLVSHFFWRPGSQMQQSIKGMLCTILYQLLCSNLSSQELVISRVSSMMKDSDTDWSTTQLQAMIDLVISQYDRPICMFLDGLDEVSPNDGVVQLLSVIQQLSQHDSVKICLSSRPEPLLSKRLQSHPHLRIQDLTHSDLRVYAQDNLRIPLQNYTGFQDERVKELLSFLVSKAEGVFLWLCLAIKSVSRGIDYGDSIEEIELRIGSLSGDLEALYEDMWDRANEDLRIYRQESATIFRLIMEMENFQGCYSTGLTIMELLLASTPMATEVLKHDKLTISPEEMLRRCQKMEKSVLIRCAGLLDIGSSSAESATDNFLDIVARPYKSVLLGQTQNLEYIVEPHDDAYKVLMPYSVPNRTVHFIHRTAYDFLRDSCKGQEILGHDASSFADRQYSICKGILASCQIFASTRFIESSPIFLPGFSNDIRRLLSIISEAIPHDDNDIFSPYHDKRRVLVETCRTLNMRGCVGYVSPENPSGRLTDLEFNQYCTMSGLFDYLISVVQQFSFEEPDLSALLCCAVRKSIYSVHSHSSMTGWCSLQSQLCHLLLEKGANPNSMRPTPAGPSNGLHVYENAVGVAVQNFSVDVSSDQNMSSWLKVEPYILDSLKLIEALAAHGGDFDKLSCCDVYVFKQTVNTGSISYIREGMDLRSLPRYLSTNKGEVYASVVVQPASTMLKSFLNAVLMVASVFSFGPEPTQLVQKLAYLGSSEDELHDLKSVAVGFRHYSDTDNREHLDLDEIHYHQVPKGESTRNFIRTSFRLSQEVIVEHKEFMDYVNGWDLEHGSLFEWLHGLGIIQKRVLKCENGIDAIGHELFENPGFPGLGYRKPHFWHHIHSENWRTAYILKTQKPRRIKP